MDSGHTRPRQPTRPAGHRGDRGAASPPPAAEAAAETAPHPPNTVDEALDVRRSPIGGVSPAKQPAPWRSDDGSLLRPAEMTASASSASTSTSSTSSTSSSARHTASASPTHSPRTLHHVHHQNQHQASSTLLSSPALAPATATATRIATSVAAVSTTRPQHLLQTAVHSAPDPPPSSPARNSPSPPLSAQALPASSSTTLAITPGSAGIAQQPSTTLGMFGRERRLSPLNPLYPLYQQVGQQPQPQLTQEEQKLLHQYQQLQQQQTEQLKSGDVHSSLDNLSQKSPQLQQLSHAALSQSAGNLQALSATSSGYLLHLGSSVGTPSPLSQSIVASPEEPSGSLDYIGASGVSDRFNTNVNTRLGNLTTGTRSRSHTQSSINSGDSTAAEEFHDALENLDSRSVSSSTTNGPATISTLPHRIEVTASNSPSQDRTFVPNNIQVRRSTRHSPALRPRISGQQQRGQSPGTPSSGQSTPLDSSSPRSVRPRSPTGARGTSQSRSPARSPGLNHLSRHHVMDSPTQPQEVSPREEVQEKLTYAQVFARAVGSRGREGRASSHAQGTQRKKSVDLAPNYSKEMPTPSFTTQSLDLAVPISDSPVPTEGNLTNTYGDTSRRSSVHGYPVPLRDSPSLTPGPKQRSDSEMKSYHRVGMHMRRRHFHYHLRDSQCLQRGNRCHHQTERQSHRGSNSQALPTTSDLPPLPPPSSNSDKESSKPSEREEGILRVKASSAGAEQSTNTSVNLFSDVGMKSITESPQDFLLRKKGNSPYALTSRAPLIRVEDRLDRRSIEDLQRGHRFSATSIDASRIPGLSSLLAVDYEVYRQRLLKYSFSAPSLDRSVYGFALVSTNEDQNDEKDIQGSFPSSLELSSTIPHSLPNIRATIRQGINEYLSGFVAQKLLCECGNLLCIDSTGVYCPNCEYSESDNSSSSSLDDDYCSSSSDVSNLEERRQTSGTLDSLPVPKDSQRPRWLSIDSGDSATDNRVSTSSCSSYQGGEGRDTEISRDERSQSCDNSEPGVNHGGRTRLKSRHGRNKAEKDHNRGSNSMTKTVSSSAGRSSVVSHESMPLVKSRLHEEFGKLDDSMSSDGEYHSTRRFELTGLDTSLLNRPMWYDQYAAFCRDGLLEPLYNLRRHSIPKDVFTNKFLFMIDEYMTDLHIAKSIKWRPELSSRLDEIEYQPNDLLVEQIEHFKKIDVPEQKNMTKVSMLSDALANRGLSGTTTRLVRCCCRCEACMVGESSIPNLFDSLSAQIGPGVPDMDIPSFDLALCAICERTIPAFMFEKHTVICGDLHTVERDVTQLQEGLLSIKESLLEQFKVADQWLAGVLKEIIAVVDDVISVPIPDPFSGLFEDVSSRNVNLEDGSPPLNPEDVPASPTAPETTQESLYEGSGKSPIDTVSSRVFQTQQAYTEPSSSYSSGQSPGLGSKTIEVKSKLLSWRCPPMERFTRSQADSSAESYTASSNTQLSEVSDGMSRDVSVSGRSTPLPSNQLELDAYTMAKNLESVIKSKFDGIDRLKSLSAEYKKAAESEEEAKVEIGRRTGTLMVEPYDLAGGSYDDIQSQASVPYIHDSYDSRSVRTSISQLDGGTSSMSALTSGIASGAVREVGGVFVRDSSIPTDSRSPARPSSAFNPGSWASMHSPQLSRSSFNAYPNSEVGTDDNTWEGHGLRQVPLSRGDDVSYSEKHTGRPMCFCPDCSTLARDDGIPRSRYQKSDARSSISSYDIQPRSKSRMSVDESVGSRKGSISSMYLLDHRGSKDSVVPLSERRESISTKSRNASIGSTGRLERRSTRGNMHIDTSSAHAFSGSDIDCTCLQGKPCKADSGCPFCSSGVGCPFSSNSNAIDSNSGYLASGRVSGSYGSAYNTAGSNTASAINIPYKPDYSPRILPTMLVGKQKLEVERISSPIISPRMRGLSISSMASMNSNMSLAQPGGQGFNVYGGAGGGSTYVPVGSNFNPVDVAQSNPDMTTSAAGGIPSTIGLSKSPALGSPQLPKSIMSAPSRLLSIDDFGIVKPISKGAYGFVYLAKKKTTSEYYAIKVLKKADMVAKNQVTNIKAERMILTQLDSPYIVKLVFSFQSRAHLYLVMEYLSGGDCASLLKSMGRLDESWCKQYVAEITEGLLFLHSRDIIHRDLKPDNVLIDPRGHVRLTDFGLSRMGFLGQRRMQFLGSYSASLRKNDSPSLSDKVGDSISAPISRKTSDVAQGISQDIPPQPPENFGHIAAPTAMLGNQAMMLGSSSALSNLPVEPGPSTPHPRASIGTPISPPVYSFPSNLLSQTSPHVGTPSTPGSPIRYDQFSRSRRSSVASMISNFSEAITVHVKAHAEKEASINQGNSIANSASNFLSSSGSATPVRDGGNAGNRNRFAGTPDYIAPESILTQSQDSSVDWWSLGVMVYEFLTGIPPFHDKTVNDVFNNILNKDPDYEIFDISKGTEDDPTDEEHIAVTANVVDFTHALLMKDPANRLDGLQVKLHPWLKDVDWDHLLDKEGCFVPKASDPEDTEYFDSRGVYDEPTDFIYDEPSTDDNMRKSTSGATTSGTLSRPIFPIDMETDSESVASLRKSSIGGSIPGTPRLSQVQMSANDSGDGEFKYFSFKNLPALEKVNNDTVNRLRNEVSGSRSIPGSPSGSLSNLFAPSAPSSGFGRQRHSSMSQVFRPNSAGTSSMKESSSTRQRIYSFNETVGGMPLSKAPSATGSTSARRSVGSRQSSASISSGDAPASNLYLLTDMTPSQGQSGSPNKSPYSSTGFGALGRRGSIPMRPRTMSGSNQRPNLSLAVTVNGMPTGSGLLSTSERSISSSPSVANRRRTNSSATPPNSSTHLTVLVIEEDATTVRVLSATLQAIGCNVSSVTDPKAIEGAIKHDTYDIIFIDTRMVSKASGDIMNILSTAKNAIGRRAPLIALTDEEQTYGLMRQFDDILSKPIKIDLLRGIVDALKKDYADAANTPGTPGSASSTRRPSGLRDTTSSASQPSGRMSRRVSQVE